MYLRETADKRWMEISGLKGGATCKMEFMEPGGLTDPVFNGCISERLLFLFFSTAFSNNNVYNDIQSNVHLPGWTLRGSWRLRPFSRVLAPRPSGGNIGEVR